MVLAAAGILGMGAAAGCASGAGTAQAGGEVSPSSGSVSLVVDNSNLYNVDVYAVLNGVARRVGSVGGNNTATFPLDRSFFPTGEVTFLATPVAGLGRASSGRLTVYPGDEIRFYVAPELDQSTAIVRPPQ